MSGRRLPSRSSLSCPILNTATATSHRTAYFLALAHGAAVSGADRPYAMTVTGATSRTSMTGVAETPDTAQRTLLYGELTRFNAASANDTGELAIVGRWKESIELSIAPAAASFSLDLIYPGIADGTFTHSSLKEPATAADTASMGGNDRDLLSRI